MSDLDSAECKEMMRGFIAVNPSLWNEGYWLSLSRFGENRV